MKIRVNKSLGRLAIAVSLLGSLAIGTAMASNFNDVVPADNWTYEAVRTLVKHGGLTDTKGINPDGSVTYTRAQLAPLMAHITAVREQMNDNDKETALKLYREYKEEVLAYNVAADKREKALKQQERDRKDLEKKLNKNRTKEEKRLAKRQEKEAKVDAGTQDKVENTAKPAVMNDVYYGTNVEAPQSLQPVAPPDAAEEVAYDNEKPEEVALTPEQIKEKMKHFSIDTSPLRISGEARVRTQGTSQGKNKSDAKASVEMEMNL